MRHLWLCIVAFVLLPACDRAPSVGSPAAPSPAPSLSPPPPAPLYTLSGVVRVAGIPVAGATVALLNFETGALITSTVTDANGSYSLSEVRNVSPYSGALVSVSRPEYFTETRYVPMSQDQKVEFELERAEHISIGQVIISEVGVAARCASLGYGGGNGAVCRRFALTAPGSETLEVAVFSTPAAPFDSTILRPDGTIGAYRASPSSPLVLTLDVAAGLTYQIDVVHISQATREFELRTTMR
jgi:Carboxypeptidase regulatory-like domain